MEIVYVGVDMGNRNSQVYGFTEHGEEVVETRIPTLELAGWESLFGGLSKRFEVHVAYEACPHYEWLHEVLSKYSRKVVMVNPAAFGVISKSQKKTDKYDARKLAQGLRRGDLPDVYVPPPQSRADRRLVSFVHWHSRQVANKKTRLRSALLSYRLDCPCHDISSAKARAWFEREALPRMDEQGQMIVKMLLDELTLLEEQRGKLDAEVNKRLPHYGRDAEVLRSVPGFGPLTVLALISMIVEIGRFEDGTKLSAYFGTCGRVHQSGDTLRLGPLTKRGNKTVRWLLSQALCQLHRVDGRARQRYLKKKRSKRTGVARGAQVNWLVKIVFQLLKKKETYRMPVRAKKAA
jgi:transposase